MVQIFYLPVLQSNRYLFFRFGIGNSFIERHTEFTIYSRFCIFYKKVKLGIDFKLTSLYTKSVKWLQYDFYKKGGRKLSIKNFTLRLTNEQLDFIGKKAKDMGISKNDYIRRLIDGDIRADKQDKILQEIIEIKEMLQSDNKKE